MLPVRLYNSYSRQVEELRPLVEGQVSLYVCGPTVYNYIHIGNTRPIVVFDILKRFLSTIGYQVIHMSNVTDVDDKIIQAAQSENVSEKEITTRYSKAYFESVDQLHAIPPALIPLVTDHMNEIIAYIDQLIKLGFAYQTHGDVYFRVGKVKNYGQLANIASEELKVGARIEENTDKESPLDFTLWKATSQGIRWPSPWSEGRPGWHTECAVMIDKNFPNGRIDIHGGGFDLRFPHHENEIAQSEAIHHHHIASIWMHNGFINIDDVKMSKSLGNVKLAKDILAQFGGNVVRMMMITSHYRAPVNFTDDVATGAQTEWLKIETALRQASVLLQRRHMVSIQQTPTTDLYRQFLEALATDLNTPNAITLVFEQVKQLNFAVRKVDTASILMHFESLSAMLYILGLVPELPIMNAEDEQLFQQWEAAKLAKDFVTADRIRHELTTKKLL